MKARSPLLTITSLIVGALLFAFIIHQTGTDALTQQLRTLNAWFIVILLLAIARTLTRAIAWLHCLRQDERTIGLWQLWRARLIGDAVGALTTAGPLLAEPARLVALGQRLPLADAAAALSLEFLSYFLSACLMMLAGLVALLLSVAVHTPLRMASWLSVALLLLVIALISLALWRRWSLVAVLHRVSSFVMRLHQFTQSLSGQLERQLARLEKLERHIFDFYRHRPLDFAWVALCEISFHLFGLLEVWLTLHLLNVQANAMTAFIFESVNRIINVVFAFVPIRLGVDEVGTGQLAVVLGLGVVTGVSVALYRKLRLLFMTAVGLLLLLFSRRSA